MQAGLTHLCAVSSRHVCVANVLGGQTWGRVKIPQNRKQHFLAPSTALLPREMSQLEDLNDDVVLKTASGLADSDHHLDMLDVAATPPCSEVVRAAAVAARPHGFRGAKLQGRPIERSGVSFSMEEMNLGLGAIAWSDLADQGKEAQPAQPDEQHQQQKEREREQQQKRPRLDRPPQPPPPPPPPPPRVCAPRESAAATAPTTAARKGKRSAGCEPPMCMELGRPAAVLPYVLTALSLSTLQ